MNRYFKICLWSPLWFPALLGLLAFAAEGIWPRACDCMPEWLTMAGFIVIMSLFLGGVQYLITMFLIWPKINFFDAASWLKWILRLPLIYAPIQMLGFLLVFGWEIDRVSDMFEVLPLAVFDVLVGYAYVAVWLLGYAVIRCVQRWQGHGLRPRALSGAR